jgi:orotate phosphoribosyltransferase
MQIEFCTRGFSVTQDDVLTIFKQSGALLTGHFVLTSGRHSDTYFEKFHVLRYPSHVAALCEDIAEQARDCGADVVLGPTTLGVLLAYEVAKNLGLPAAYAEKNAEGKRFLRRPEHLLAGQRVLVVDDILTTGGSIKECITFIEEIGATLCGVGVLVDRCGGIVDFGAPLYATLSLTAQSYAPDEVPDWLAAIPVTRPGSTGKK